MLIFLTHPFEAKDLENFLRVFLTININMVKTKRMKKLPEFMMKLFDIKPSCLKLSLMGSVSLNLKIF